jgi:phage major head subunit gpT-like protein
MATPTPAQFQVFLLTANTMIRNAWSYAPTPYADYTTTVPTESETFEDGWIGRMPKMREWLGSRVVHSPGPQTYVVTVQNWENTYGIDEFLFDDTKFGIYYPLIADLGLQGKRQPGFVIRDMLENTGSQTGARQNGLDGLTYFNTAHLVNIYKASLGSYSNDFRGGFTVGGVTVGGALSGIAVGTAAEYMMTYTAEDGERFGITPNKIIAPPTLRAECEYILKNQMSAPQQGWQTFGPTNTQVGASDNVWKRFGIDYMIDPNLMSNVDWYLADTTKSVKPVRWIQREGTTYTPRVSPTDENVWLNHQLLWGARMRGTSAWGPSWLMAKSGPTANA